MICLYCVVYHVYTSLFTGDNIINSLNTFSIEKNIKDAKNRKV